MQISVFIVEAIMYLLLYNLYDCTFNNSNFYKLYEHFYYMVFTRLSAGKIRFLISM